jgi:hypothetical protein
VRLGLSPCDSADEDEADAAEDFELGDRGGFEDDLEFGGRRQVDGDARGEERGMGGRPNHPDDSDDDEEGTGRGEKGVDGNDERVVFAIDDEESEEEEEEGRKVGGGGGGSGGRKGGKSDDEDESGGDMGRRLSGEGERLISR